MTYLLAGSTTPTLLEFWHKALHPAHESSCASSQFRVRHHLDQSRELSLYLRYQRTQSTMISNGKSAFYEQVTGVNVGFPLSSVLVADC
jgi:hypothetical protein